MRGHCAAPASSGQHRNAARAYLVGASLSVLTSWAMSGCSSIQDGRAFPEEPRVTPSTLTNDEVPGNPFAGMSACSLLDQALTGQGFKPAYVQNAGSRNGCASEKTSFAVALDLDDQQGLGDLRSDPHRTYDASVNGRAAKQVRGREEAEGGACEVFVEVTTSARAAVTVVLGSGGSTTDACHEAGSLTEAIEPLLPPRT